MAEFGWAYLDNLITAQGVDGSLQFASGSLMTGSSKLTFNTASNTMFLTGTMIVSGTIQANTFDIIHTTRVDVEYSGSTAFGNSSDDTHQFTGSVEMDFVSAQTLGNPQTITKDTTVMANHNAVLWGPITISGDFTIGSQSNVKIKDIDDI